jgi:hypothetical protein
MTRTLIITIASLALVASVGSAAAQLPRMPAELVERSFFGSRPVFVSSPRSLQCSINRNSMNAASERRSSAAAFSAAVFQSATEPTLHFNRSTGPWPKGPVDLFQVVSLSPASNNEPAISYFDHGNHLSPMGGNVHSSVKALYKRTTDVYIARTALKTHMNRKKKIPRHYTEYLPWGRLWKSQNLRGKTRSRPTSRLPRTRVATGGAPGVRYIAL